MDFIQILLLIGIIIAFFGVPVSDYIMRWQDRKRENKLSSHAKK